MGHQYVICGEGVEGMLTVSPWLALLTKSLSVIILPPMILFIASWAFNNLSNRDSIRANRERNHPLASPITMRITGYDLMAARQYFDELLTTPGAMESEARFLALDLSLPLLCGAALLGSLWWVWTELGRPFTATYLFIPVAIFIVADWIENLVLLSQLQKWPNLQEGWIQVASYSTVIKLATSVLTYMGLLVAIVALLYRARA
jgi:hypothetical protein